MKSLAPILFVTIASLVLPKQSFYSWSNALREVLILLFFLSQNCFAFGAGSPAVALTGLQTPQVAGFLWK